MKKCVKIIGDTSKTMRYFIPKTLSRMTNLDDAKCFWDLRIQKCSCTLLKVQISFV